MVNLYYGVCCVEVFGWWLGDIECGVKYVDGWYCYSWYGVFEYFVCNIWYVVKYVVDCYVNVDGFCCVR